MELYSRYYKTILNGYPAKPRGLDTIYLHNQVFHTIPYVMWRRPKDNIMIGIMEGLQFIAGTFDSIAIQRVAPHAKLELFTGQSAYGPRVGTQLEEIVELICKDRWTRQAVLMIADYKEPLNLRPCTTSLQFQVNQFDTLSVTVNMRSSDAIWGLPYDLIQFSFISHVVAACTGYILRSMCINLANAHIYEATKLDKPTFTKSTFSLTSEYTEVHKWKNWASFLIPYIDMERAKKEFYIRDI